MANEIDKVDQQIEQPVKSSRRQFKASKRRWVILLAIFTFGFFNGVVNGLNSILNPMVKLLAIPLEEYIFFGQLFGLLTPVLALPVAWLVDRHGLKWATRSCLLLVLLRNGARALLFWPTHSWHWHQLRMLYWPLAGCTQSLVVVIYYCLPLKISEAFFPERERSLAWSSLIASPLLGTAFSATLNPALLGAAASRPHPAAQHDDFRPISLLNLLGLLVTAAALGLGLDWSEPEEAPSGRRQATKGRPEDGASSGVVEAPRVTLWQSIKALMNKDLLILIGAQVSFSAAEGCIKSLLQDVFAKSGLSASFCGHFLSATNLAGASLLLASAWWAPDKQKPPQPEEQDQQQESERTGNWQLDLRCKWLMVAKWAAFAAYILLLSLNQYHGRLWWLLLSSSLLWTTVSFCSAPQFNSQLAQLISQRPADSRRPVSEAQTGAMQTITSYLMTNIYTLVFMFVAAESRRSATGKGKGEYFNSLLLLLSLVSASSLLYLTCFGGSSSTTGGRQQEAASSSNNRREVVAETMTSD